jgi:hypothetical protein
MIKKLWIVVVLIANIGLAQQAHEVYLFDFIKNDSTHTYTLKNPINISDNIGYYDNQPSFLNDGMGVLFASTRNDQTDIVLYDIELKEKRWMTNSAGSEYSPQQTPNKKFFSAIKLETDDTQLLWHYSFRRKKPRVLVDKLKIGYHAWLNEKILVSFVLGEPSTLQVTNLKYKIKYPIDKNIGRSIHKIPTTELISFISLEHDEPEIYSINPLNSEKIYIADPLEGSQDMAWMPDKTIVMGKNNKLYKLKPGEDKTWIEIASVEEFNLTGITRIAVSPLGNKIAIVVQEPEENNIIEANN